MATVIALHAGNGGISQACERRKVPLGQTEPLYEKLMLRLMGAARTEQVEP